MIHFIKSIFRILKTIIFVIFLIIIVALCVNNAQVVSISLKPLPYELETKLFLLIIILFFGGFILGILISGISVAKSRIKNFFSNKEKDKDKKREREIENQLNNLSN